MTNIRSRHTRHGCMRYVTHMYGCTFRVQFWYYIWHTYDCGTRGLGVYVMSHMVVRLEFNSGIMYGTHTIAAHEAWMYTLCTYVWLYV